MIEETLAAAGLVLTKHEIAELLKRGATYALFKIDAWILEMEEGALENVGEAGKAAYNEGEADDILPGAGMEFAADAEVCSNLGAMKEVAAIELEGAKLLIIMWEQELE